MNYLDSALDRMDVELNSSDLSSEHIQSCLEQWKRVVMFYSLRLMLAPVIETVVQLDRLLYLTEQGNEENGLVYFSEQNVFT